MQKLSLQTTLGFEHGLNLQFRHQQIFLADRLTETILHQV
jgi:hypothetical protein